MTQDIKILIIRFSSIGDIVLTTPVVKSLKEKYPDSKISYLTLTEYSNLLKDNPSVDDLILFNRKAGFRALVKKALELRKTKFDYVFDFHRSTRSLIFRILLKADHKIKINKLYFKRILLTKFKINKYKHPFSVVVKYYNAAENLSLTKICSEIWIDRNTLDEGSAILKKLCGSLEFGYNVAANDNDKLLIRKKENSKRRKKIVCIMPFAAWPTKEWGDDRFVELGKKISLKHTVFVLGGPDETLRAEKIASLIGKNAVPLAGRLSLRQVAIALSASDCLVTCDTGVMHIASAVSIPTVALFGCTTQELGFFPYSNKAEVIQVDLPCRPCTAKGRRKCPKRHFKCMNDITVDMVYNAVMKKI